MPPLGGAGRRPRGAVMKRGLILFAHGARDARWAEPFDAVARRVREQAGSTLVRLAFLELMTPSLAQAGGELAEAGCTRVDVVPLFLGVGGHLRKDLPALVDALVAAWPGVRWQLHGAVGEDPALIEAMASIAASRMLME